MIGRRGAADGRLCTKDKPALLGDGAG